MFSKVKPVDVRSYPSSVNSAQRYDYSSPKIEPTKKTSKQKTVVIVLGVLMGVGFVALVALIIGLALTLAYLPAASYNQSCLISSCKAGTNLYCNSTFYCDCKNQTQWFPSSQKCDKPLFGAACTADADCYVSKGQSCVFSACRCAQTAMHYWSAFFAKCRQCQVTPQSTEHCFIYPATSATYNGFLCEKNYPSIYYTTSVVISSDTELQIVKNLLTTNGVAEFWVGAYYGSAVSNNSFLWIDDTILSADSKWWATGYPKNPAAYACVTVTANGLTNQDCNAYTTSHLCEQP